MPKYFDAIEMLEWLDITPEVICYLVKIENDKYAIKALNNQENFKQLNSCPTSCQVNYWIIDTEKVISASASVIFEEDKLTNSTFSLAQITGCLKVDPTQEKSKTFPAHQLKSENTGSQNINAVASQVRILRTLGTTAAQMVSMISNVETHGGRATDEESLSPGGRMDFFQANTVNSETLALDEELFNCRLC